jgi:translocation and assembly module TamB
MSRRRALQVTAAALASVVLIVAGILLFLTQTQSGRDRVRGMLLGALANSIDGEVRIGRIEGNLLRGVRLIDVEVLDRQSRPFVKADTIETRFSLRGIIRKRLDLSDVRLVNADVVLDKPPGEEWNWSRILLSKPGDTTSTARSAWGKWVVLRNVDLVNTHVAVKTAWDPPDGLSADEREAALAKALSPDSRPNIIQVPGGYQNVMDFRELNARVPRVLLAHPDSSGMAASVERLSGILQPYRPPVAEVREMSGAFRFVQDSLFMTDVRASLPGSRFTGERVYSLESGELLLKMRGDPAAFADLRWLMPGLPEEGGGSVDLEVHRGALATRLVATNADFAVRDSRITGKLDVTIGDTMRVQDTDLRLTNVDTHLVSDVLPALTLPRHGRVSGHVVLAGTPSDLDVDSDITFVDAGGTGTSRFSATGGVAVDGKVTLRDLRLRFDPLQAALARAFVPGLPLRGTILGSARLTGDWGGTLQVASDLTLRDPRGGPSRVQANGGLDLASEVRLRDLRVVLSPLHLDPFREQIPNAPRGATLIGSGVLNGTLARAIDVNGDFALNDPASGVSRFGARGGIGMDGGALFRNLRLQLHPLQVALLPSLGLPEQPVGGTVEGTVLLNGSPTAALSFEGDVVHSEGGETTHLAGSGRLGAGRDRVIALDLRSDRLSLATIGRFVPQAGLHGTATGTIKATGNLSALDVDADLLVPGGGRVAAHALLDLDEQPFGYDVSATLANVDLAAISTRVADSTSLTGTVEAVGRGFDPATMDARVAADLRGVQVGDIPTAEQVVADVRLAGGLATFAPTTVRMGGTRAAIEGSFGLVEGRVGTLSYDVTVDSLATLAPWLPDADTTVAAVRAGARKVALEEARARYARELRSAEVERIATGRAPAEPMNVDTLPPPSIPRDSLAGSLHAAGQLRGNIHRFDADGRGEARNLIFRGNFVESGEATYRVTGIGAPGAQASVDAKTRSILVQGMAYDSASLQATYTGDRVQGTGTAKFSAYQDQYTDIDGSLSFVLEEARKQLLVEQLQLRVDTVTWTSQGVAQVAWAGNELEVHGLDLRSSTGGRLHAEGRLPTSEPADLELIVENVDVANIAALLQTGGETAGRVWFNGRVTGTRADPRMDASGAWKDLVVQGSPVPDARGTFYYENQALKTNVQLLRGEQLLARAEGTIPIDLGLSGGGFKLLDAPISLDVHADSVPIDAIAAFSPDISEVQGAFKGDFRVTGTIENPTLEGSGNIVAGAALVEPLGIWLTDIAGGVRLAGKVLTLDSLVAVARRGTIQISGQVDLSTLTQPTLDLRATADEAMVLDNEQGRLTVDADLTISGPLDDIFVQGDVRTRHGVIYIPQLTELGQTQVVSLDDPATLERLDTLLAARREALVPPNPLLQRMRASLAVSVDRDVWMRSIEANVEIYTPPELGPLSVRLEGARRQLLVEGTINTDRGEYEFMSRRFQLTRGAVTFLGEPDFDGILQVAAEHPVRIPGRPPFAIRVILSGTVRAPAITLESTSQPPISQTDLLTYLAFGGQAASLLPIQSSVLSGSGTANGDLAGQVAALATQQLATAAVGTAVNDLEGEATRSLGVDVFRITPADLPEELFKGRFTDVFMGTEIEIGSYVTPRLFVAGQARPTMATPGLTAEYVTPLGFKWRINLEPRFVPTEPTLGVQTPIRQTVFGMFLFREWRY